MTNSIDTTATLITLNYTPNMKQALSLGLMLKNRDAAAKLTPAHVENSQVMRLAAEDYCRQYQGHFDFMLSMQANLKRYGTLKYANHIAGILNCLVNEYVQATQAAKRAEERQTTVAKAAEVEVDFGAITEPAATITAAAAAAAEIKPQVPAPGLYTIVNDDETYTTLRASKIDFGNFPEGTIKLSYLNGPDNEINYNGFAHVMPDGKLFVWQSFRKAADLINAAKVLLTASDQGELGLAYAMQSGRCCKCGRTLTVPASLHRGMGPVCANAK